MVNFGFLGRCNDTPSWNVDLSIATALPKLQVNVNREVLASLSLWGVQSRTKMSPCTWQLMVLSMVCNEHWANSTFTTEA